MLAVECVALLVAAGQRRERLLLGVAYGVGIFSFLIAVARITERGLTESWITGASDGALLLLAAWWSERLFTAENAAIAEPGGNKFRGFPQTGGVLFFALGAGHLVGLLEQRITVEQWNAPLLSLAAVLLTASVYVLRIRAIPVYAQGYLLLAWWRWIINYGEKSSVLVPPPWWNPLILLAAIVALGHWWQRKDAKKLVVDAPWQWIFSLPNAVAVVVVLHLWLEPERGITDQWIGEMALLALALLAYGLATGYRSLAVVGQWFLLFGAAVFLKGWHLAHGGYRPEMWMTLGPWAGLLLTVIAVRRFVPASDRARFDPHGTGEGSTRY